MTQYSALVLASDKKNVALKPILFYHNDLEERDATGAHPATAIDYSNTASGLAATTAQAAIDEVWLNRNSVTFQAQSGNITMTVADFDKLFESRASHTMTPPQATDAEIGRSFTVTQRGDGGAVTVISFPSGYFYTYGNRANVATRYRVAGGEIVTFTYIGNKYYHINRQQKNLSAQWAFQIFSNTSLTIGQHTGVIIQCGNNSADITLTLPALSAATDQASMPHRCFLITPHANTSQSSYLRTLAATGTNRIVLPTGKRVTSVLLPKCPVLVWESPILGATTQEWYVIGLPHDASQIPFTPSDEDDWDSAVTTVAAALDELAARVRALE